MNRPLCRSLAIAWLVLVLLPGVTASPALAQVNMQPVACPVWDYWYPSPGKAAEAKANSWTWYGAGSTCKPIAIAGCESASSGPADQLCTGIWNDVWPRCPATQPQIHTGGMGYPVAGNII